jgi:uncharacterized YccA/Bax inhibitor family protein
MTAGGTQSKIAILTALCAGAGYYAWGSPSIILIGGGAVIGLILALIISFKPATAPILAPMYALAEGCVLGAISKMYEGLYHGIVMQAVLVTGAVFCVTLAAYVTRVIQPTQRFVSVVTAATGGVVIFYLISFGLSFFGITLFSFSSPISILFSIVVCGIAAANLIIDYAVIESGIESQAPKYMEWYSAFGLLVTVIWLYLEILRLLAKLRKRD